MPVKCDWCSIMTLDCRMIKYARYAYAYVTKILNTKNKKPAANGKKNVKYSWLLIKTSEINCWAINQRD